MKRKAVPDCVHHWVLDRPVGALTRGRCKRCGAEREFRDRYEDWSFGHPQGHVGTPPA